MSKSRNHDECKTRSIKKQTSDMSRNIVQIVIGTEDELIIVIAKDQYCWVLQRFLLVYK